jgi:hypothetical protein
MIVCLGRLQGLLKKAAERPMRDDNNFRKFPSRVSITVDEFSMRPPKRRHHTQKEHAAMSNHVIATNIPYEGDPVEIFVLCLHAAAANARMGQFVSAMVMLDEANIRAGKLPMGLLSGAPTGSTS